MISQLKIYDVTMSFRRKHAHAFLRKLSAKSCFCIFNLVLVLWLCSGCASSKDVSRHPKSNHSRDIRIIDNTNERDSVFVKVMYQQIRDTIFRDSIAVKYRFISRADTILVTITDTIWLPGPEKIVKSPISKIDSHLINIGKLAVMVVVFIFIFLIIKIKS